MKKTIAKPKTFLLWLLISFPSFVAVLISPALPSISDFFHLTNAKTQQLILQYLIGYAFAQLIYCPFANYLGRKSASYLGLALYTFASIGCIIAIHLSNFNLLLTARFFSAMGASAGLSITYTIINDYYPPEKRRAMVGYVTLAFAIIPSIANFIGGFLTTYLSWRYCFYFLLFYAPIMAVVIYFLPETLLKRDRHALKAIHLFRSYRKAFRSWPLTVFASISGLATIFVYISLSDSPFIGMDLIGLKASVYGTVMLIPYLGQLIGCLSVGHFSHKISPYSYMKIGFGLIIFGSVMMFLCFILGWISIVSLIMPLFFIMIGLPITYSNTSLIALLDFKDKATGSSVMSFIVMFPTVIMLYIRIYFLGESFMVLPSIFLGVIFLMILIFGWAVKWHPEPK